MPGGVGYGVISVEMPLFEHTSGEWGLILGCYTSTSVRNAREDALTASRDKRQAKIGGHGERKF